MIEQYSLEHHIQKHIVNVLMHQNYARFRDMRPPNIDTNLYSYHLKLLQKNKFVEKTSEGYRLGVNGVVYVDRINISSLKVRLQPKIVTMLVIQNSDGDVLLFKRKRQPFIDTWTLPYGKLHVDDDSIVTAVKREMTEKLNLEKVSPDHAGECYIRIRHADEIVMSTLGHIFYLETDEIVETDRIKWARPHKLSEYDLAPAVEQIVARTFFRDPYFFEEYTEDW